MINKNIIFFISLSLGILSAQLSVSLGNVEYSGYSSDIEVPVIINNPNNSISGMQFDLMVYPDIISPFNVSAYGSPNGFTADMNQLSTGGYRFLLFNAANASSIPTNSDTIMVIHFNGSSIPSAVIDLGISNLTVSDSSGGELTSTSSNGMISIGNVVGLMMNSDSGDVSESVHIQVSMDNNGTVGGLQFDLLDTPDNLSIDSLWTTDRTNNFTISSTDIGAGTRVVMYSTSNNNVSPGNGPVLNIRYLVNYNAYGGDVLIAFNEVTVSDSIGGIYWISELDTGKVTVFPGYMEEPHNLIAVSGLDAEVPLSWSPPLGPVPPTVPFTVEIFTDYYPGETSWDLVHADGDSVVASIFTGELADTATLYTWDLNIPSGGHVFTIYDSYGDGICCGYGEGYYRLLLNGTEIASGGEFEASESVTFNTSDGRFNIVEYSYLNSPTIEKDLFNINNHDLELSMPFFVNSGFIDLSNNDKTINNNASQRRTPDVSGYNLYRSSADSPDYELIASVGADEIEYIDTDVMNGVTYYYYVTTDYTPLGTESGPSNIADATPVEWVELSISDGAALSGYTDTLDISINNEAEIGFFYIEISDDPDYIIAETVLQTDRTQNYTLSVTETNGVMVVSAFPNGSNVTLSSGSDPVCRVIVRGASMEPAYVDLDFTFANIEDYNGVEMNWTGDDADFEVSVETQVLAMPNMVVSPGEGFIMPLMISNSQPVSAIQLSLSSQASYITGVTVVSSDYMDFSDWYFGGNQDGSDYNVIITDLTLNNPIMPGMGHIADIYLYVDANTPSGSSYPIEVDKIVADANSIGMFTEMISSSVFVGTPMAHFSIDTSFSMSGSATRTIPVYLDNIVPISVFEMTLMDMPDGIIVTSVDPLGRFVSSDGEFLEQSGENEDGNCFIFGYVPDPNNSIPAGSGPIFQLTVQRKNTFGGQLGMFFGDVTARDENTDEVTVAGTGYAMLSVALELTDTFIMPDRYKLHQNYPNPFNPTTVIQYDVPELSKVSLTIYDLSGREINQLVNDTQSPGLKTIVWDGKDFTGNRMGAGVYIYQLKSGNFVESKKMIFVK